MGGGGGAATVRGGGSVPRGGGGPFPHGRESPWEGWEDGVPGSDDLPGVVKSSPPLFLSCDIALQVKAKPDRTHLQECQSNC